MRRGIGVESSLSQLLHDFPPLLSSFHAGAASNEFQFLSSLTFDDVQAFDDV